MVLDFRQVLVLQVNQPDQYLLLLPVSLLGQRIQEVPLILMVLLVLVLQEVLQVLVDLVDLDHLFLLLEAGVLVLQQLQYLLEPH